jgi:structure-specific endonuclease subunit SLX1
MEMSQENCRIMPPKKKAEASTSSGGEAKEVEHFFGVYLLYCTNPKYKGRTYIGFTVDPNRRINQHNKGKQAGGAWKTSNRGPWEMVLIVHGFPNDIAALRFEWSWQHPARSRRLRHVPPKKSREKTFDFCIRLLANMLNTEPWRRLPLTIRWLKPEYERDFSHTMCPPLHMPLVHGPVRSVKAAKKSSTGLPDSGETDEVEEDQLFCNICFKTVSSGEKMECLNIKCGAISHIICLSQSFLASEDNQMIPIEGNCVTCETILQWGDLIRKKNGCYNNLASQELDSSFQDD